MRKAAVVSFLALHIHSLGCSTTMTPLKRPQGPLSSVECRLVDTSTIPLLRGVSKLELHNRGVRARVAAKAALDLAIQRREQRDTLKVQLAQANQIIRENKNRPTWWLVFGFTFGGISLGAIIGASIGFVVGSSK